MINVVRKASFSRCQQYRYQLSRHWDFGQGRCVFIGLNPSTADVQADDPTIRRCMGFAQNWGYREVVVVNLFAYRTPHPSQLKLVRDPVGARNRRTVRQACHSAEMIVAAWGNHGMFQNQAKTMSSAWTGLKLHCFGTTLSGQPLHPLYQPGCATLQQFDT